MRKRDTPPARGASARGTRIATLAALVVALATLATVPAHAATGWDRCNPGTSCYFKDANGLGDMWVAPSAGRWDLSQLNPPFNDRISSVWNRGGGVVRLFNFVGGTNVWEPVASAGVNGRINFSAGQKGNDTTDLVCVDVGSPCPDR